MTKLCGTAEVVNLLRSEGFRVAGPTLAFYLREGYLSAPETRGPGGAFVWGEADIQRLRSVLHRRGRAPEAAVGEEMRKATKRPVRGVRRE